MQKPLYNFWFLLHYVHVTCTSLQATLVSLIFTLFKHYIGITYVNISPDLANSWVVNIAIENRMAISIFIYKCILTILE